MVSYQFLKTDFQPKAIADSSNSFGASDAQNFVQNDSNFADWNVFGLNQERQGTAPNRADP
jgi:hypothetical protein